MNVPKTIVCILTVIVLLICSSYNCFAAEGQVLECGIDIKAEFTDSVVSIIAKNNNEKNVVKIKYVKQLFNKNEILDGKTGIEHIEKLYEENKVILAKKSVESVIEKKGIIIPSKYWDDEGSHDINKSDIVLKLFFYYVEFEDGTKWGNEYPDIDYVVSNYKPIVLKNTVSTIDPMSAKQIFDFRNNTLFGSETKTLLIILIVFIVIFVVFKRIKTEKQKNKKTKGSRGEQEIFNSLNDNIGGNRKILKNLYLTKSDGKTTEIDLILIHETGIYVIESKNYIGWIFGNESNSNWTQSLNKGNGETEKNRFYNPIMQNHNHIRYLQKELSDLKCDIPYYSVIVFGNEATLKDITVKSDDVVITEKEVVKTINALMTIAYARHKRIQENTMNDIYQRLFPMTQVSDEVKEKHIKDIKEMNAEPQMITDSGKDYIIKDVKPKETINQNQSSGGIL